MDHTYETGSPKGYLQEPVKLLWECASTCNFPENFRSAFSFQETLIPLIVFKIMKPVLQLNEKMRKPTSVIVQAFVQINIRYNRIYKTVLTPVWFYHEDDPERTFQSISIKTLVILSHCTFNLNCS